jgi:hypothetical protein
MTEPPVYNLTSLTDKQWDRQLASQEKLELAKIQGQTDVQMEQLRMVDRQRSGRRDLLLQFLVGLGAVCVIMAFLGAMYFGIARSANQQHERAVECIKSQGRWIEGDSGDGDRCDRP